MQIEIGKYYKTRDGQKVGPMRRTVHPHANMRFTDDEVNHWTENGTEYNTMPSGRDLISEWVDESDIGTLRDLNVQVGDVVKWLVGSTPVEYTIGLILGDRYYECDDYEDELSNSAAWRIISRASQPSPVITETVTTQRIVPGVYGRVSIAGSSQTSVELEFVGEYGATGRSRLSQAELTAAITTLTAIRDALTHNSAK